MVGFPRGGFVGGGFTHERWFHPRERCVLPASGPVHGHMPREEGGEAANAPAEASGGPSASALELAVRRLTNEAQSAAEAGTSLTELELLRRALNQAADEAGERARIERERENRERMAREPTKRMKEELKWALFHAVWQVREMRLTDTRQGK